MTWLRMHRWWIARRTTQVGILALFWLGAHHHVGILTGNLSSSHVLRTIPLADPYAVLQILATGRGLATSVLVGAGIVLFFYWVVGGRAFCGWVCPVDLIRGTSGWLRERFQLKGQFRVAASTRYWLLGLSLLLSALLGVAAFEWISPIGMIQREIIFGAGMGLLAIPAILLVDLFIVKDGWCGALCPLGAFYGLLGRVSLVRMGFVSERCDRCGDCVKVCPEHHVIDYAEMDARGFIASGDCLNCARCLEVCPRDAYHLTLRPLRSHTGGIEKGDRHATQNAA